MRQPRLRAAFARNVTRAVRCPGAGASLHAASLGRLDTDHAVNPGSTRSRPALSHLCPIEWAVC